MDTLQSTLLGLVTGAALVALPLTTGCGDDDPASGNRDAGGTPSDPDAGAQPDGGMMPPGPDNADVILSGSFEPLMQNAPGEGPAQLVRMPSEMRTRVSLQVANLQPNTEYPAHVHSWPCEFDAGPHYKIDPSITEELESNEIWLTFTTNADGRGFSREQVAHVARGDALSVVIHDPQTNAKMLCADLQPAAMETLSGNGTIMPFAAGEGTNISGSARIEIDGERTQVMAEVEGLDASEEYISHVHVLPCAVENAGGHYKIDPSVEANVEDNELWLDIEPGADGTATAMVERAHRAREDAQSLVIHRIEGEQMPKVACADLPRQGYTDAVQTGDATLLDEGEARGYGNLMATGRLMRERAGTTMASIELSGLMAGMEYPIHVHELPCDVAEGGAHYKIDPSVEETVESNEIWLNVTADANGAASRMTSVDHLARAEAQSMVIHDGADNARLACIDLQTTSP